MAKRIAQVGKLRLAYAAYGHTHYASVALTTDALTDAGSLGGYAQELAEAFAACQPNTVAYDHWDFLGAYGNILLTGAFPGGAPVGSHSRAGEPWRSFTIRFEGKETAPGSDGKSGRTSVVLHVYDARGPLAGLKYYNLSDDSAYVSVATVLEGVGPYWAGFHGNKANLNALVPIQFNAHTQRVEGS